MKALHVRYATIPFILATLGLGGCASLQSTIPAANADSATPSGETVMDQVAEAVTPAPAPATAATAGSDLLPPNAKPGQCYARVFIPPTYKTEPVRVLKSEASERINVAPARYEMVEDRVLVKEASERVEVVPATYEWVEERVLVTEASKRVEATEPVYKTVTEQVLDKPEHTVWKKGSGPITKIDEATGEIMCLVTVPASYKTVTKRVLVTPAGTREVEIPAEYKTVRKQVMKTPPTTRTVEIPAEYKTVKVRKMVEEPKTTRTAIPEQYDTVNKRVLVSDGYLAWQPVLCRTNLTNDVARDIQSSLQKAGHNPGDIDGVIGRDTLDAVESYQRSKGLPRGGLTLETLDSLGIEL